MKGSVLPQALILRAQQLQNMDNPHISQPNVRNTAVDEENNVTYQIMAFRQMNREEVVGTIRQYLSQPSMRKRKKPERNKVITITTSYGLRPGL